MPRTCLACSHPEREAIDNALATGEPLRNIAKRVSISPAGLLRHKGHVAAVIVKAQERREEDLGDSIFAGMRRVLDKGWELLKKAESEGDTRGAVVALREIRASLESIDAMQSRADETKRAEQGSQIAIVVNPYIPRPRRDKVSTAKAALPDSRFSQPQSATISYEPSYLAAGDIRGGS